MRKFFVESWHEVYADSFMDGEGDHKGSYNTNGFIYIDDDKEPVDAVIKYMQDVLNYKCDPEHFGYNDEHLNYDVQTDVNNNELDEFLLQAFKRGKPYYINHVSLQAFEMTKVKFLDEKN